MVAHEESKFDMRSMEDILQGEPLDEFLMKCAVDPKVFMERVIGLEYEAKAFHIEWFNAFLKNKRSCIVAPRGFGKTEVCGVIFFLWIAMFKRNRTMILVSKTKDMSKEIIYRVRHYIESNELLLTLKPDRAEKTWTKTELGTTTNCILLCRPYGQNIRTWHVNYLLCDEAAFYDDKSSFYFDIIPVINTHNGNLMVISTPQTMVDLVAELSRKPMYFYRRYKARTGNKSMWPEKFSIKRLKEMEKEQGNIKFSREYLCEVKSEATALFPTRLLMKACDDNDTMQMSLDENEVCYFGSDFALAAKGNYSVYITLQQIGNKLKVVYMERPDRGTNPKVQEERIKQIYKRFPIIGGRGDNGSFGTIIVGNLISSGINIEGFDFQAKKEEVLLRLRRKFENNEIIIPTGVDDPYTKKMSDILLKELSEIMPFETKTGKETYKGVGAYDDSVMALAMAVWATEEYIAVDAMIEFFDE